MALEHPNDQQPSLLHAFYRFLGGTAVGLFMAIVPYLISPIELNGLSISVAVLLVLSCGLLAVYFGEKFVESLTRLLDSSGLY
ncbi:MAG: hypothetical protein J7647_20080 [Cyanobacteria bacterium SBLK]|nr:hypothetical protein [Cyanobacteria bacterium SBLK]